MWIEIFRTGEHTDSSGRKASYDAGALDKIAEIYNSKVAESKSFAAPIVKGHPKTDAPAFGWIERLARRGDKLLAKAIDADPKFVEEVRKGLYRKISMAIYPDMTLRHVGFLGAASPAVKGLELAKFTDGDDFSVYANKMKYDDRTDSPDELTLLKKQNREFAEKVKTLEKHVRLKEFREFATELSAGKSLFEPGRASDLIDILEAASDYDARFAESEEPNLAEKIKDFISGMKPPAPLGEFAFGTPAPIEEEFGGRRVNEERLALHKAAREIQSQTPGISYEEAALEAERRRLWS